MNLIRKIRTSFSTRLSFYVLLFTILIFLVTFYFFYYFTSRTIIEDARERAEALLDNISLKIEDVFSTVKTAPENVLWAVINKGFDPDSLYPLTRDIILHNEFVFGSAVAFEPNYFKDKGYYFSPYSYRDGDTIRTIQLGTPEYDYPSMEWYKVPKELNQPYWTEPYYDEGGGQMLMSTYSNPIRDKDGNVIGILTVDVSLDWLTDVVNRVKPYPSSYTILLGREGRYIVHPNKEMILNETIFSVASEKKDLSIAEVGQKMVKGEKGMLELKKTSFIDDANSYIFYKPLAFNNWSLGMVIHKEDVFKPLYRTNRVVIPITIAGLILLFVFCMSIVRRLARPLSKFSNSAREIATGNFDVSLPQIDSEDEMRELYNSFRYMQEQLTGYMEELKQTTANKERIESELRIARDIQMGMIPKIFPPFPDRDDVDLYAILRPAKEVGGDLYDFFIESGRLFFIIGDVSGKGVPASLFMAVTRSLFRSVAVHYAKPAYIVSSMNNSIAETNESNMFVTLFAGILDLATGELCYCNAGHNPPVLICPDGKVEFMRVHANIPVGLFTDFDFKENVVTLEKGTTLFLYTDGLTEAENSDKVLYSEARLLQVLRNYVGREPQTITKDVVSSVEEHVNGAEQSDDLTILTINY